MKNKLGLYIHIPFCKQKCRYCDFYSVVPKEDVVKEYFKALTQHISEYNLKDYLIDTIYIGGGTPSCVHRKYLKELLKYLHKNLEISKYVEITVECNPESMDKKLLKSLKKSGVNRLSIGVQSAIDSELAYLGRIHNFEKAKESYNLARKIGFDNISLDLMFALPNSDTYMESLNEIIALNPEHISCYGLKLEEGTPLFLENPQMPDDDTWADSYIAISEKLTSLGYEHYEISNFSKAGFKSRHNSRYWNLSQYLGFGPSAHSFFADKRFSFVDDVEKYIHGVINNENITENMEESPYEHRHGEYIMLALRTSEGIDPSKFLKEFSVDFSIYAKKLEKYIEKGYATYSDGRYSLTTNGFLISTAIIADILER